MTSIARKAISSDLSSLSRHELSNWALLLASSCIVSNIAEVTLVTEMEVGTDCLGEVRSSDGSTEDTVESVRADDSDI